MAKRFARIFDVRPTLKDRLIQLVKMQMGMKKRSKKHMREERRMPNTMNKSPAKILEGMADTFDERNKVYGDNGKLFGEVVTSLFPNGVVLKTEEDYNIWHLFELLVVKITRFANSELKHQDSIRDTASYRSK